MVEAQPISASDSCADALVAIDDGEFADVVASLEAELGVSISADASSLLLVFCRQNPDVGVEEAVRIAFSGSAPSGEAAPTSETPLGAYQQSPNSESICAAVRDALTGETGDRWEEITANYRAYLNPGIELTYDPACAFTMPTRSVGNAIEITFVYPEGGDRAEAALRADLEAAGYNYLPNSDPGQANFLTTARDKVVGLTSWVETSHVTLVLDVALRGTGSVVLYEAGTQ